MNSRYIVLVYALFTTFVFGQQPTNKDVLFVISGGYNSCARNEEPPVAPSVYAIAGSALEQIKNYQMYSDSGRRFYFVYSCFTNTSTGFDVTFNYGKNLGRWYYKPIEVDFETFNANTFQPYFQYVLKRVKDLNNPQVVLVGHSYGGWTIQQLAKWLVQKNVRLKGVETIDPISPIMCQPWHMAMHIVVTATFMSHAASPQGCLQGTGKFDSQVASQLNRNNGWWFNSYQTSDRYLHSGHIDSPVKNDPVDHNWRRRYYTGFWIEKFHRRISTEYIVWLNLLRRFQKKLP